MKSSNDRLLLTPSLLMLLVATLWLTANDSDVAAADKEPSSEAADKTEAAGENLALNRPYEFEPRPTYSYCTDPGDRRQLTDGQTTQNYFWTQEGTVGWVRARYVSISIDLGQVEPIGGVTMTTAAGTAGVVWPGAVRVMVSDDGSQFRDVGDLVAIDRQAAGPFPEGYAIRRMQAQNLRTRGRYVRLLVLPRGPYFFTDEIQVLRGPESLLEKAPTGEPVPDAKEYYVHWRLRGAIENRFASDLEKVRQWIESVEAVDDAVRQRHLNAADKIGGRLTAESVPLNESFEAVLPFNADHASLFALVGSLRAELGAPALEAWAARTWDPVELVTMPPESPGEVCVHTMRGEYRAAAVNLANNTNEPLEVRLSTRGLPGELAQGELEVHEVQWTDTVEGLPVAAALPEAARQGDCWKLTLPPGLTGQVWLTFHVVQLPADEYVGELVFAAGDATASVPLRLKVYPLDFPRRTSLWVGGWSYTNGQPRYGVTSENLAAFLSHMRERFVNAPWATSSVMFSHELEAGPPLRVRLDTQTFDQWIDQWPDSAAYLVFLSVGHSFDGQPMGTPEFDRRVGAWISAWVEWLRTKDIEPGQLGLLLRDEPNSSKPEDAKIIVAWAKAISAAQPDVLIWEDPTYRNPAEVPPELFAQSDVLCPNRPMWLANKPAFDRVYLAQREQGKKLHLYSCSGPAKLLDPYSYHRLQAWEAWRVGAEASFFWALGDNSGSSSWNEYLARSGPYTPIFLDSKRVVAGKHMEAIRESVEDYEYFVMLQDAVEKARAAGSQPTALAEAERLLNSAANEVLQAPEAANLRWHHDKDRGRADAVRVELLKALLALRQPEKR